MSLIKILGVSLPVLMAAGIWVSANSDSLLDTMGRPAEPTPIQASRTPIPMPEEPAAFDAPAPDAGETSWPVADLQQSIATVATIDIDLEAIHAEYSVAIDKAHVRLRPQVDRFLTMINDGIIPSFKIARPNSRSASETSVAMAWSLPTATEELFRDPAECSRSSATDTSSLGIIGLRGGASIDCTSGNNWYLLGDGPDVVADDRGDDVVIMGGGDDRIALGDGTDVILLDEGWGHDTIDKSCTHSMVPAEDASRIGWEYAFVNFVVVGAGLMPEDFLWETPTRLVHAPSGDSLDIANNCFNLVFVEPGAMRSSTE